MMRSALALLVIGIGQVALAALYPCAAWLLVWSGLSFCAVAAAYAFQKPRVFGKRPEGTLAWGPCLLLLPYLLLTWLIWYCQTRFTREAVCDEIAPGLWLGRRAAASELPPSVTLIVDLTSEFGEPRALRTGRAYLCLPTLDNAAPEQGAFRDAVQKVAAWEGGVYVHCALGHGRSALVAAAVLMARGLADGPEEALLQVKRVRPGVRLDCRQWAFLKTWR
jgi:protein-tyrosine phosphatase